ncbi:MAG: helix-turn-helix domain-containing protein [Chloroflexota bacterium]|nr:helix-turn-helix domain-containing protein [Chloroflexota bacterium]
MTNPNPLDRLTFTVEEAAALLRIGRGLAYQQCRTGSIPTVRVGRRLLVPRVALERLLSGDAGPQPSSSLGTMEKAAG